MAKLRMREQPPEDHLLVEQSPGRMSLTSRAVNASLGGLASLGNLLDVPGSMVRDVVSLSNPLDQLLTPFSPDNRVTGRDILRSVGLISQNDSLLNATAGLALELAVDPMTYVSLGTIPALSKGGKAAKALGLMPEAERIANAKRLAKAASTTPAPVPTSPGLIGTAKETARTFGTRIGPRRAARETTLEELVASASELGHNELPARFAGTPRPDKAVRVREALDRYARANGMASGDELLRVHGKEPLVKGVGSVGLPFTEAIPFDIPQSEKLAAAMDAVGALASSSLPARAIKAMFTAPAMGQLSEAGQALGTAAYESRKQTARRVALWGLESKAELDSLSKDFQDAFGGAIVRDPLGVPTTRVSQGPNGLTPQVFAIQSADSARDAIDTLMAWIRETTGRPDYEAGKLDIGTVRNALKERLNVDIAASAPDLAAKQERVADKLLELTRKFSKAQDDLRLDLDDRGIDIGLIGNDVYSYWARRHKLEPTVAEFGSRIFPSSFAGTKSRSVEIANLPRDVVQSLVSNPAYRVGKGGIGPVALDISTKYDRYLDELFQIPDDIAPNATPADMQQARAKHATAIAEWIQTQPRAYAKDAKAAYYPNSPVEDAINHLNSGSRVLRTADAVFATLMREATDDILPGSETVWKTLKDAGYNPEKSIGFMAKTSGMSDTDKAAFMASFGSKQVPSDLRNAIVSITQKTTSPAEVSLLMNYWDRTTSFLKENLTVAFPAFHLRNFGSGQGINLMSGDIASSRDYAAYYNAVRRAHTARLKPEDHAALIRELQGYDVYKYGFNPADPNTLTAPQFLEPPQLFNLGMMRRMVDNELVARSREGNLLSQRIGFDPAGQTARVTDKTERGYEMFLQAGRQAAATAEWYNRVPMYLYLRDHVGMPAEVAAQKVRDLHVDYSELSGFEKSVMRRVVPFYSFTRAQLGQLGQRLMEKQGGIPFQSTAATIKAIARLRNPGELVPDYVAETASIPLGGENEQGDRNYLTGFGLAFEDPLSFFGKGLRGAGMEALSRTNPFLKAPLEYATGELFFQAGPMGGRDLPDADPLLGRTLANVLGREAPVKLPELVEVAVANSPLSRYLSTTRQLTDPRKSLGVKALNLGTGIRVATVSEGSRDAILREQVQQELREIGAKQFVRTYVPEQYKAGMSPQELQQADRLSNTLNELAKRARKRKEQRELAESAANLGGQ